MPKECNCLKVTRLLLSIIDNPSYISNESMIFGEQLLESIRQHNTYCMDTHNDLIELASGIDSYRITGMIDKINKELENNLIIGYDRIFIFQQIIRDYRLTKTEDINVIYITNKILAKLL